MIPQWTTQYVQSDNSLDVPPPYFFPSTQVQTITIEADMGAVQEYCDTYLNIGPREERGFEYRAFPLWPYARLVFLYYPMMISALQQRFEIPDPTAAPTHARGGAHKLGVAMADRGVTQQNEVFLSIPVMRYGLGAKGRLVESELEWILPFIVVDQPWSCVCGREMLGLGKMMSHIEIGQGYLPGSFLGRVHMPGWSSKEDYLEGKQAKADAEMMASSLPFLDVKTGPVLPTFRNSDPYATLATAFADRPVRWAMERMSGLTNFVETASFGLVPTTMQTVSLKQHRDARYPSLAVYQALISCHSRYSGIRELEVYDEREIDVIFNEIGTFDTIVKTILGTDPDVSQAVRFPGAGEDQAMNGRKAKVVGAFRFTADVSFDNMHVLHEFPIRRSDGTEMRPAYSSLTARWFRPLKGFFGKKAL